MLGTTPCRAVLAFLSKPRRFCTADFDYPSYTRAESAESPFGVTTVLGRSPWSPRKHIVQIGVQGYVVPAAEAPAANLVLLIGVSDATEADLKLLKAAFKALARQLRAVDTVTIFGATGSAGVANPLPPTRGDRFAEIAAAIDGLGAVRSAWTVEAIETAYEAADAGFLLGGTNRVVLCTDAGFVTPAAKLVAFVRSRSSGGGPGNTQAITLTTLGFGSNDPDDALLEKLADAGDGNYYFIDRMSEARKVLVDGLGSTLQVIAKDAKLQLEFNPSVVAEYRLLGYDNRRLDRPGFDDDDVDAGDVGSGHSVTAVVEIRLVGSRVDPSLRYQPSPRSTRWSAEVGFMKLRYQLPGAAGSVLEEHPILLGPAQDIGSATRNDLMFASAVAGYGQLLRGSKAVEPWYGFSHVAELARHGCNTNAFGADTQLDPRRAEFVQLALAAAGLSAKPGDTTNLHSYVARFVAMANDTHPSHHADDSDSRYHRNGHQHNLPGRDGLSVMLLGAVTASIVVSALTVVTLNRGRRTVAGGKLYTRLDRMVPTSRAYRQARSPIDEEAASGHEDESEADESEADDGGDRDRNRTEAGESDPLISAGTNVPAFQHASGHQCGWDGADGETPTASAAVESDTAPAALREGAASTVAELAVAKVPNPPPGSGSPVPPPSPASPTLELNQLWHELVDGTKATEIDYVLGSLLGRGAAGTVFKAFDQTSGDFFAAKQLDFSALDVPQMQLVAKEITMLKGLSHPHIVSYRGYDLVPADANLLIFMDYCAGGDLQSVLKSFGGLSTGLIRRYTRQICTGLAYLHGASVLHRDIKAANVLLTLTGEAKLSDFGLARIVKDAGSRSVAGVGARSGTSSVVGSPYWMAPEVIRGEGSSTKSDVWSLGATVFEMASAKPPLAHLDTMAALFHIGNARPMGAVPASLGKHGTAFVNLCMRGDRDERPSCAELLNHPFFNDDAAGDAADRSRRRREERLS